MSSSLSWGEEGRALWVANDVRRDVGRIGRDVGRIGRDVGRIGRDVGRIGRDVGRIGHDVGRIGRSSGCRFLVWLPFWSLAGSVTQSL